MPDSMDVLKAHMLDAEYRTLLLLDTEREPTHHQFLSSSMFVVLDADKLMKKRFIQKKSVSFLLQEVRNSLVYAMKNGKILVVRMADSKTDFLNTFCDESCRDLEFISKYPPYKEQRYLPRSFLLRGGASLREPALYEQLFHREDTADLAANPGLLHNLDRFRVIITSTMPRDMLEPQLINAVAGLPGTIDDYHVVKLI